MADPTKQVFRIVIAGSQEAIFHELTATDRPLGAIFNSHMHTTGLRPGGRLQMRTVSGGHVIVEGDIVETGRPPFKARLMYAMFGALEFVLPAKTKSERWPLEPK